VEAVALSQGAVKAMEAAALIAATG